PKEIKPEPTQVEKLRKFLEPEIAEGIVAVLEDANTITVRIIGGGMFKSASDVMKPEYRARVQRVAEALNDEPGNVLVVGHSDSDPLSRRSRFKSNLDLSLKRAQTVMAFMAKFMKDPDRLRAEGRGAREPLKPNTTRENKAQNRRIEVILLKAN
ncbi:MAG: type VI secretion system protein TssL, partial [Alphaproteobacteria bacterium]